MSTNVSFSIFGEPTDYSNQIDLIADVDLDTAKAILVHHGAQVDANVSPDRLRLYYSLKGAETVAELRERDHALRLELEALGLYEAPAIPTPAPLTLNDPKNMTSASPTPSAIDLLGLELVEKKAEIAASAREISELEHQLATARARLQAYTEQVAVYETCIKALRDAR